jgi:putative Mg2+ transporter-C (MgtC) family protein
VIQAIVVGISFLGAGTILRNGTSHVEGLTTAASILLTTALGIAVALGKVGLAFGVAMLMVVVLLVLGRLERALEHQAAANDR